MHDVFQSLIDFMAAHAAWTFWIALLIATAENTAVISVLFHATPVLAGVGALAATGRIDFTPIFLGAALGSVIGSTVSWYLGLVYGDRILQWKWFAARPALIARGRAAFDRWGPAAIVVGHFFFAIRPVVFLMCGMARMPGRVFLPWNTAGSVLWAWVILKFGEVFGLAFGWLWHALGFG